MLVGKRDFGVWQDTQTTNSVIFVSVRCVGAAGGHSDVAGIRPFSDTMQKNRFKKRFRTSQEILYTHLLKCIKTSLESIYNRHMRRFHTSYYRYCVPGNSWVAFRFPVFFRVLAMSFQSVEIGDVMISWTYGLHRTKENNPAAFKDFVQFPYVVWSSASNRYH